MNGCVLRKRPGLLRAARMLRLAGCLFPVLSGGVAGAQTVASLPLQRGFYVAQATPCGSASHATLRLVMRDGIVVSPRHTLKFRKIEKKGPTTYLVSEFLEDSGGSPPGPTETATYEIPNQTTFKRTSVHGTSVDRYCAQPTLPLPWRNNDISSIIR